MRFTRSLSQSVALLMVCLLISIAFAAQIDRSIASAETTSRIFCVGTIAHKRCYVNGSIIRDGSGAPLTLVEVFKMRSLTYYSDTDSWSDENESTYDLIKSTGANTVRLALNKYLWENDFGYKAAIDRLVAICKERGLYVVMNFHTEYDPATKQDLRNFTKMVTDAAFGDSSDWKDFMIDVAERYKDEPTVIGLDILDECPSNATSQEVWRTANIGIIDAIHTVDPSYLVFVGSMPRTSLLNFGEPYPRSNLVYEAHVWYAWDVGFGSYADAYYNAETEAEFSSAYAQMRTFYQDILTFFRDKYEAPVEVSTGIGKVAYNLPSQPPLKNAFRQFTDQTKLFADLGIHWSYFSADRDFSDSLFWNLLDENNPGQLSQAGVVYKVALDQFYPMF